MEVFESKGDIKKLSMKISAPITTSFKGKRELFLMIMIFILVNSWEYRNCNF